MQRSVRVGGFRYRYFLRWVDCCFASGSHRPGDMNRDCAVDQSRGLQEVSILTDAQIAILCDIGQASSFDEKKNGEVLDLVVRGYFERDGDLFKSRPGARSADRSGHRS